MSLAIDPELAELIRQSKGVKGVKVSEASLHRLGPTELGGKEDSCDVTAKKAVMCNGASVLSTSTNGMEKAGEVDAHAVPSSSAAVSSSSSALEVAETDDPKVASWEDIEDVTFVFPAPKQKADGDESEEEIGEVDEGDDNGGADDGGVYGGGRNGYEDDYVPLADDDDDDEYYDDEDGDDDDGGRRQRSSNTFASGSGTAKKKPIAAVAKRRPKPADSTSSSSSSSKGSDPATTTTTTTAAVTAVTAAAATEEDNDGMPEITETIDANGFRTLSWKQPSPEPPGPPVIVVDLTAICGFKNGYQSDIDKVASTIEAKLHESFLERVEDLFDIGAAQHSTTNQCSYHMFRSRDASHHVYCVVQYPEMIGGGDGQPPRRVDELWAELILPSKHHSVDLIKERLRQCSRDLIWKHAISEELERLGDAIRLEQSQKEIEKMEEELHRWKQSRRGRLKRLIEAREMFVARLTSEEEKVERTGGYDDVDEESYQTFLQLQRQLEEEQEGSGNGLSLFGPSASSSSSASSASLSLSSSTSIGGGRVTRRSGGGGGGVGDGQTQTRPRVNPVCAAVIQQLEKKIEGIDDLIAALEIEEGEDGFGYVDSDEEEEGRAELEENVHDDMQDRRNRQRQLGYRDEDDDVGGGGGGGDGDDDGGGGVRDAVTDGGKEGGAHDEHSSSVPAECERRKDGGEGDGDKKKCSSTTAEADGVVGMDDDDDDDDDEGEGDVQTRRKQPLEGKQHEGSTTERCNGRPTDDGEEAAHEERAAESKGVEATARAEVEVEEGAVTDDDVVVVVVNAEEAAEAELLEQEQPGSATKKKKKKRKKKKKKGGSENGKEEEDEEDDEADDNDGGGSGGGGRRKAEESGATSAATAAAGGGRGGASGASAKVQVKKKRSDTDTDEGAVDGQVEKGQGQGQAGKVKERGEEPEPEPEGEEVARPIIASEHNVVDCILAMIMMRFPREWNMKDDAHFKLLGLDHKRLKDAWLEEFGILPTPGQY